MLSTRALKAAAVRKPFLPVDHLTNVQGAYSLRRLNSNYSGYCIRIRRNEDNAETDIGFTPEGRVDEAAVATFLAASSPASTAAYIVTWYDQSGNGRNASQATASQQPLLLSSGINGRAAISFDGSNDILTISHNSAFDFDSSGVTLALVLKQNAFNNQGSSVNVALAKGSGAFASQSTAFEYDTFASSNKMVVKTGTSSAMNTVDTNDGVARLITYTKGSSISNAYINGSLSATKNPDSAAANNSSAWGIGGDPTSAARYMQCEIGELVICSTVISGTPFTRMNISIKQNWGI